MTISLKSVNQLFNEHFDVKEGTDVTIKSPDEDAGTSAEFIQGGMEFSKVRVCGTTETRWIDNTLLEIKEKESGK